VALNSLLEWNEAERKMREAEGWQLLRECGEGLKWLQNNSLYHLNIKPGNILKCQRRFKLSDIYGKS
jgi:serine/threonine protein kinase